MIRGEQKTVEVPQCFGIASIYEEASEVSKSLYLVHKDLGKDYPCLNEASV